MNTKQFLENLDVLLEEFPKWNAPIVTLIAITSKDPFRVFISTLLSLRTKDAVTSMASKKLFAVASTPEDIVKLSEETIRDLIYPVGFYKTKATRIRNICIELIEKYDSKIPNTLEELLKFKGVGRKTANLTLALGYNIEAICVDTHVHRISNRWGYVNTKTPEQTEFALMEKTPKEHWIIINDLLVGFGQTICKPVKPMCHLCKVKHCPLKK